MQLFGRRARADSHGRFHLSCDEMAELYRGFHIALADTYWETPNNHKICNDAMEAIRTTHISTKSGRFLKNFTALVREVFSHAHYNVQELLYDERIIKDRMKNIPPFRDTIRQEYWTKISKLMEVVLRRAEHIWSTPCSDKLSILLQFASLYSLYKDVAEEEFIQKIYDVAVNGMQFQQTHKNKKDKTDDDKMYDYFDQIQLVYRLRKEIRRGSISGENKLPPTRKFSQVTSPAGPLMEHRQSRLATKEELDDFFNKIMREQQRQRRGKQKSSPVEKQDEEDVEPQLDMWVSSSSSEHSDGRRLSLHVTVTAHEENTTETLEAPKPHHSTPSSPSTGRRHTSFVHLPEIMSVIKKLNPVHIHPKSEEPPPEMGDFDYKAEFEKRFNKRPSVGSVSFDLPVIAKPNPVDRVYSYRRQGLFNDRNHKRRAGSDSNSIKEANEEEIHSEELKENKSITSSNPSPPPDSSKLIPPPKPPRAHSPRTMERLMVEAVVNGGTVESTLI